MNVKSLILGAALVIAGAILGFMLKSGCGTCEYAQGKRPCEVNKERPYHKCDRANYKHAKEHMYLYSPEVLSELELNDTQKEQISAILEAKKEQMQKHREAMRVEKNKIHAQIQTILTPEQNAKLDSIKQTKCPMQDAKRANQCKK